MAETKITYDKVYYSLIALLILVSFVFPHFTGVAAVLLLGGFVFGLVKKELVFEWNPILVMFILFYLYYLASLFTFDHQGSIASYVERKMAFFFIPLFFLFKLKEFKMNKLPVRALLTGILILAVAGLVNSLMLYSKVPNTYYLMSSYFSFIHHPTYFSAYAFLGMLVVRFSLKDVKSANKRYILGSLFIIMIIVQLLCSSLAGLLILMLYFMIEVLLFVKRKFGKIAFVIAMVLIPVFAYLSIQFIPGMRSQFNTSKQYLSEYISDPYEFIRSKQTYVGGNETRLIMWTATWLEISAHPEGVGPANLDQHLGERLKELGQPPEMVAKQLNPHNQYLQTALETGVLGMLILLVILGMLIYRAVKTSNWLLLAITLNLTFNMFFESMLQRQSGIVFYTLMISMLMTYPKVLSLKSE